MKTVIMVAPKQDEKTIKGKENRNIFDEHQLFWGYVYDNNKVFTGSYFVNSFYILYQYNWFPFH